MTDQLSLEPEDVMHEDLNPNLPQTIVLDNREESSHFLERLDHLPYLNIEPSEAVSNIIETIQKDSDAEYELEYDHHIRLPRDTRDYLREDIISYLQLRLWYAKTILSHLRLARLYVEGMLFYQFHHIDKSGLMLQKLHLPILNYSKLDNERERRIYGRQIGLAHRRSVHATTLQSQIVRPL